MTALTATRMRVLNLWDTLAILVPMSVIQLLARIGIAGTFFKSGLTKVDDHYRVTDLAVELFKEEYKVPFISPDLAAHIGAFFELTMPILLVAGFLSRLATLPLLGMTLVIEIFVYPDSWEIHGTWAALLLLILSRGPGLFSIDALIGLEKRKL